ncbi:Josephin-domain-containing protein [Hygrophoropsis aurantiaca]|uniref:Josephin-domain-containing protein n=1 Tax=Hygrophoropsis aurantiaca TaxID=72124 RepID=A0ACB8ALI8_9AGAM|nr:Josephin-domain-containing protein [Hygrophoropsis aurantiaca]
MAGLEGLVSMIYHEKQQSGSMLCAQHALNSLLQGNYFTAPDLSTIAASVDELESSYDEGSRGRASTNMDDTGFFSVQVLESALDVWGLRLARWRSEEMRPYQTHPHTQLAFILNQNQHWYTLRRFGPHDSNTLNGNGDGHWFNLNSSESSPQWISKLYLDMFLQHAESDGYSVFVVIPIDLEVPLQLPRTEADDLATAFPEPSSASSNQPPPQHTSEPGFEDEDMELQAALQASLMGESESISFPPALAPSSMSASSSVLRPIQRSNSSIPPNQDPHGNADVDPVAASMARNQAIMRRMRDQQELALREGYEEEVAARFRAPAPAPQIQSQQRQTVQPQPQSQLLSADEDDDDTLFRRAMAESLADRQAHGHDDMELDDDEYHPTLRNLPGAEADRNLIAGSDRVYDDDDAELQAALKASLESVPHGFVLPPSPLPQPPKRFVNPPIPLPGSSSSGPNQPPKNNIQDDTESEADTSVTSASDAQPIPELESVSVDEMRRRRLARFGG